MQDVEDWPMRKDMLLKPRSSQQAARFYDNLVYYDVVAASSSCR